MHDEPQPGLFKEILGNVPAVRQPRKEVVEPAVESRVDHVERVRIADPQAFDELELDVTVHRGINAEVAKT